MIENPLQPADAGEPIDQNVQDVDQQSPAEVPAPTYTLEQRKQMGGEVDTKYSRWLTARRPHELRWFITAAYRKGKTTSEANPLTSLQDIGKIDKRKKNIANKLWAKGRARFAKFAKTRPKPIVVPFIHERRARLNARMTERALDYFYERSGQEEKYNDVLLWAQDTGKAYWVFHYDPDKKVPVKTQSQLGEDVIQDLSVGDITLEVSSAFEWLVPDMRIARIGNQPEAMRVRVMAFDEVEARVRANFSDAEWEEMNLKADAHMGSPFEFERQIAHLSNSEAVTFAGSSMDQVGPKTGVLVKELYRRPTVKYPKGRQIVVVGGYAVSIKDELPHTFYDMENPYPVAEFMDMPQVGQFYVNTFAEQLIPLQRGYNILRDKLEQQIRMNVHPKWIVWKQARIAKGALTNEASEVVEANYIPGMPAIMPITPGSIVADAWRFAGLLKEEFDDISQVYPSFEGKAGTAKSGLQTSLLQEASDSVHSPDARGYELAIQDAAYKIRRMMKNYYDVPRLMSFSGRSRIPEVFEFSQDNIDEHALIRVQVGSGLSTFKAARVQQLLDFHKAGLLGDPNDPQVKRRVLSLVDLGGVEEFQEHAQLDEDMASMENLDMLGGKQVPVPQFFEDHLTHYNIHTDELKNPANKELDKGIKYNLIAHTLLHLRWINPNAALQLAQQYGMGDLIQQGYIPAPQPTPPPQGAQPGGQPQPGAPAPATPTNVNLANMAGQQPPAPVTGV